MDGQLDIAQNMIEEAAKSSAERKKKFCEDDIFPALHDEEFRKAILGSALGALIEADFGAEIAKQRISSGSTTTSPLPGYIPERPSAPPFSSPVPSAPPATYSTEEDIAQAMRISIMDSTHHPVASSAHRHAPWTAPSPSAPPLSNIPSAPPATHSTEEDIAQAMRISIMDQATPPPDRWATTIAHPGDMSATTLPTTPKKKPTRLFSRISREIRNLLKRDKNKVSEEVCTAPHATPCFPPGYDETTGTYHEPPIYDAPPHSETSFSPTTQPKPTSAAPNAAGRGASTQARM